MLNKFKQIQKKKDRMQAVFTYGKYFFKIVENQEVLAISRKFSTELLLQKGKDEIHKYAATAEILDFSNEDFAFTEEVAL